jgi:cell division control protein 7
MDGDGAEPERHPPPSADLQMLQIIGGGTFSWVYSALYKGKRVAVKRIKPGCAQARILGEAELLHRLRGENNVVALLDVFRVDDQVDLVLPYFNHVSFRVRWFCF